MMKPELGYCSQYTDHTTGCMVSGSNDSRGKIFFSSPQCPDWLWGPPSSLLNAYRGPPPGVKQMRHDVDHSPASNTTSKTEWSYTSTHPICLDGMKRDNFDFYIY
jgi:hypothetical protein